MRVSESRRKRYNFFDKLKKTLQRWFDKAVDILGKPVEALDDWLDRYYKGFDAGFEKGVDITVDCLRNKHKVIKERCNHIEAVISEMELNYPELHAEADSIDKALEEIRRQVE